MELAIGEVDGGDPGARLRALAEAAEPPEPEPDLEMPQCSTDGEILEEFRVTQGTKTVTVLPGRLRCAW